MSDSSAGTLTARDVAVTSLLFDDHNPRLGVELADHPSQREIFEILWRDFAVDELASSISANGYFSHEPLLAAKLEGTEKLCVIEGNRRLAALKALLGLESVPQGVLLPEISTETLEKIKKVPVVETTRDGIWQYICFKHVNGPQAWQSASKAQYIGWVRNDLDIPLEDIARQIGDRHSTVMRLYRALMVIEQAERQDVFQRSDRWKSHFSFSHLYTGLDYAGIQDFLKVRPVADQSRTPVPDNRVEELGELCVWLYGSKSRNAPPVVISQNPDLRVLDEVIQKPNGLAALRQRLPLQVSREISKGDDRILRESLVAARQSLQTARGKVITGFMDQADLVKVVTDIQDLAYAIEDDMSRTRRRRRPRLGDDDVESDE